MANNVPQSIQRQIAAGKPFILDGGLGSELEARGCDLSSALWSAELILRDSDRLLDVHRAFVDAGANCITTATYQASLPQLRQRGLSESEAKALFENSISIARKVCGKRSRQQTHPPLVAASIGPYGAYLADGSEYRGNYGVSDRELLDFHAMRLRWLDQGGADLIAVETIPDLQEARVLAQLLMHAQTPAWVSFCCRDAGHLHDGNLLNDAIDLFDGHPRVFALGANCCATGLIEDIILTLKRVADDKLIVVYPNSGERYDAAAKLWHGQVDLTQWSELAGGWYAAGAAMIGGCCRIGPEFIRALADKSTWHC